MRLRPKTSAIAGRMSLRGILLLSLVCVACGSSPAVPAKTEPTKEPAKTAEAAPEDVVKNNEDPGAEGSEDEPKVPAKSFAELQKAAMACTLDEAGSIVSDCEGFEAWTAEQPAFDEGRANPQLLEMLASKDVKARILAAERLRMTFNEENLDEKNAERLFAAAEAEREPGAIKPMVDMITGQNLVKIGKTERAVAIAKAHPNADFREEMLLHIGFFNRDKVLVAWARDASKDPSGRIRNGALRLASYHTDLLPDEACKLVDGFRTDKDDFVKDSARTLLAEGRKCTAFYDKLLDDLGSVKLVKETPGKFGVHFSYGTALRAICGNPAIDEKVRAKAIKAAKRFVDTPGILSSVRENSIEAIGKCDPKGAKE